VRGPAALYRRFVERGVLIIDDYGHWKGARQAVDEYFGDLGSRPFLSRLDYTGRLAIKLGR
jgi:O-methyltransferase